MDNTRECDLVTVGEAAKYLGISAQCARDYMLSGRLPVARTVNVGQRVFRWTSWPAVRDLKVQRERPRVERAEARAALATWQNRNSISSSREAEDIAVRVVEARNQSK